MLLFYVEYLTRFSIMRQLAASMQGLSVQPDRSSKNASKISPFVLLLGNTLFQQTFIKENKTIPCWGNF